eukprot:2931532-Amphidinium_carterae.1
MSLDWGALHLPNPLSFLLKQRFASDPKNSKARNFCDLTTLAPAAAHSSHAAAGAAQFLAEPRP